MDTNAEKKGHLVVCMHANASSFSSTLFYSIMRTVAESSSKSKYVILLDK